jgi:hypothetical protein
VVAANNAGTCYVWRMMRGATASTHFEPLHKLKAHSRAPHSNTWLNGFVLVVQMSFQGVGEACETG